MYKQVNASGKIYFQNSNLNKIQSECPPGFSDYNNNDDNDCNCSYSTIHDNFDEKEDNRNKDYTNNHINNIRNNCTKFNNVDMSFDIQHFNESYATDEEQHNYVFNNANLIDQGFKTHRNQDKNISKHHHCKNHHCDDNCSKLNHRDESDNDVISDMDIHISDIDTVKKNIVNNIYYDISVNNHSKGKAYLDPLEDDDFDPQQMF